MNQTTTLKQYNNLMATLQDLNEETANQYHFKIYQELGIYSIYANSKCIGGNMSLKQCRKTFETLRSFIYYNVLPKNS